MDIIDRITTDKTLIFAITPGRSGTQYLAKLLACVEGVSAHHEPAPNYVDVLRRVQQDPEVAFAFLRQQKLPAIATVPEPVYAETSHLFCKGFLEPLLLMGLRPHLIFLHRAPADVAWSLVERNTVPARTLAGCLYLLDPRDPNVLPLSGWERMTDYQLCFWYAIEIERRQLRYVAYAKTLGLTTFEVLQRDLGNAAKYAEMLEALGLNASAAAMVKHKVLSAQHHNGNKRRLPRPDDLMEQEAGVWRAVLAYEPLLSASLEDIYRASDAEVAA